MSTHPKNVGKSASLRGSEWGARKTLTPWIRKAQIYILKRLKRHWNFRNIERLWETTQRRPLWWCRPIVKCVNTAQLLRGVTKRNFLALYSGRRQQVLQQTRWGFRLIRDLWEAVRDYCYSANIMKSRTHVDTSTKVCPLFPIWPHLVFHLV